MLRKIGIFLLALLISIVIAIVMQPDHLLIERSLRMNVTAEKVFQHVNNLRAWQAWSPWEKIDPQMKRTYEGPESGVGASYHWSGNDEVGEGRMTIVESVPPTKIKIQLDFIRPMEGHNQAEFTLTPEDATHTIVNWKMDCKNTLMGKVFQLVFNLRRTLGRNFEKGLEDLKIASRGN